MICWVGKFDSWRMATRTFILKTCSNMKGAIYIFIYLYYFFKKTRIEATEIHLAPRACLTLASRCGLKLWGPFGRSVEPFSTGHKKFDALGKPVRTLTHYTRFTPPLQPDPEIPKPPKLEGSNLCAPMCLIWDIYWSLNQLYTPSSLVWALGRHLLNSRQLAILRASRGVSHGWGRDLQTQQELLGPMRGAVVPAEMKFRGCLSHRPAKNGLFQVMKMTLRRLQHTFSGSSSSLPLYLEGDRGPHQGPLPADRTTWRYQNLMVCASCWDRNLPGLPGFQHLTPAIPWHHQRHRQLQVGSIAGAA